MVCLNVDDLFPIAHLASHSTLDSDEEICQQCFPDEDSDMGSIMGEGCVPVSLGWSSRGLSQLQTQWRYVGERRGEWRIRLGFPRGQRSLGGGR
jgi:hypothetical protein